MKKQLLKLSAACIALTIGANAMAQDKHTASIKNIGDNTITVDGTAEAVWANVDAQPLEVIFKEETPDVDVTWKGIWSAEGIYVLVEAVDDVWAPSWVTGKNAWESDHVELYFDVSDPQMDAGGPANGDQKAAGNYQVAPNFKETSGEVATEADGSVHATTFDTEGVYAKEFFVPFSAIQQNGANIDPTVFNVIGFDVTVLDHDGDEADTRQRICWSNDGTVDESWNNSDGVGLITFDATEVGGGSAVKQTVAKMDVTVVNGQLTFKSKVSNVTVLNSIGQVVAKSANVSTLPKGVYVVTAKTAKGDAASKFVIK
jgi:hypothetical protein